MDAARKWTDAELDALEKRMAKEYRQAANEMREKQEKWLAKFAKEREQREKALDSTQEAMDAHNRWLQSQAVREQWFSDMVDGLSESAHRTNQKATDMINGYIPRIYAENANRAAYAVDKAVKADTGFALVNEDAVRYLMGGLEDGQLIHEVTLTPEEERMREGLQSLRKDLDAAKDIRWNRQKFTSAITQGILQGESIRNIVKRTESVYGQNMNAAVRAARTATTSAENAGRMNSFERAERLGIDMEIEWLATLDGRTRDSHRLLDGERIHTGEKFSNGLRWPGDPRGRGSEIWNCRCRANGRVVGFDGKRGDWADKRGARWSRLPKGVDYDGWKGIRLSQELSENPRNDGAATQENFFRGTETVFARAEPPSREPDYGSGSGSEYWYTDEGVYRRSDHWGSEVASCDWYMAEYDRDSSWAWSGGEMTGFAKWEDFSLRSGNCAVYDMTKSAMDFDDGQYRGSIMTTIGDVTRGKISYEGKEYVAKWDRNLNEWTWVFNG